MKLYPFKLSPVLNKRPWGGGLETVFAGKGGDGIGESWELSLYPGNESTIANGGLAGKSLSELIANHPMEMLGDNWWPQHQSFPLLIKLIGAKENLSVQVHPDDRYATIHGQDQGKAEMWYIVSAEPESSLIIGLKPGVDRAAFLAALEQGRLETVLNRVPVQSGDAFFIPPGTVHAICAGIVLAEIQQSSDITYRIFDWNRLGCTGPRELHIDNAMSVINFQAQKPEALKELPLGNGSYKLATTPWFSVEKLIVEQLWQCDKKTNRFEALVVLAGSMTLTCDDNEVQLVAGDTVFIPASVPNYEIVGQGFALRTYL